MKKNRRTYPYLYLLLNFATSRHKAEIQDEFKRAFRGRARLHGLTRSEDYIARFRTEEDATFFFLLVRDRVTPIKACKTGEWYQSENLAQRLFLRTIRHSNGQ